MTSMVGNFLVGGTVAVAFYYIWKLGPPVVFWTFLAFIIGIILINFGK